MIEQYDCWCNGCEEFKRASDFHERKNRPLGRHSHCKACYNGRRAEQKRVKLAEYRISHPPKKFIGEAKREEMARKLCGAMRTYWHIGETNPRFGVAMIGGGYV